MIPKIIHYCWVGNSSLPAKFKKYIKGWRELCPEWTIKEWNEESLPMDVPYLANAYSNSKFSNVSNYARLLAVYNEGGIYLDIDVEMVKAFDYFLEQSCFFGFQAQRGEMVNGAVFGAEQHHPFIRDLMSQLLNEYDGLEESNLSGPGLVTSLLNKKGLDTDKYRTDQVLRLDDVTIFPIDYFYPYHWNESFSSKCIKRDTFAVHHWAATWWSPKDRLKLYIKKLRQRLKNFS